jgi:hypothetical protein
MIAGAIGLALGLLVVSAPAAKSDENPCSIVRSGPIFRSERTNAVAPADNARSATAPAGAGKSQLIRD